jgi:hypothetical protein
LAAADRDPAAVDQQHAGPARTSGGVDDAHGRVRGGARAATETEAPGRPTQAILDLGGRQQVTRTRPGRLPELDQQGFDEGLVAMSLVELLPQKLSVDELFAPGS